MLEFCIEAITGRDDHRQVITQNLPHSNDCRARMTELMRQDEHDKVRVEKAEGRQAKFKEEIEADRQAKEPNMVDPLGSTLGSAVARWRPWRRKPCWPRQG